MASYSGEPFRRGVLEVGVSGGGGIGVDIGAGDSDEVRQAALFPRLGAGLTDPLGDGAWYRGSVGVVVEAAFLQGFEPETGFAGGASLSLRYRLLALGRWVPYIGAGAGMLGTDLDVGGQRDGFNFALQGEVGTYYLVSRHIALTASCRLHHISNARLDSPNGGINQVQFLLGAALFPE